MSSRYLVDVHQSSGRCPLYDNVRCQRDVPDFPNAWKMSIKFQMSDICQTFGTSARHMAGISRSSDTSASYLTCIHTYICDIFRISETSRTSAKHPDYLSDPWDMHKIGISPYSTKINFLTHDWKYIVICCVKFHLIRFWILPCTKERKTRGVVGRQQTLGSREL